MKKITLLLIMLVIFYGLQMMIWTSSTLYLIISLVLSVLLLLTLRMVRVSEATQKSS